MLRDALVTPAGEVCAIGSVMVKRGIDASDIDVCDSESIASTMGISEALVKEIEYINDEYRYNSTMTDEKRFQVVRGWIVSRIKEES